VTAPDRVHAFPDALRFGGAIARALRLEFSAVRVHRFPDGESLVHVHPPVGQHAVLVRSLNDPNPKLVEVLLAADALRRAGARRVTLVAPYLPYMRQDTVFAPGEPVSQRVVGAWLGTAFDRVLTVEAHLHRVHDLADVVAGHARSLSAAPAIAAWVRRNGRGLLVGPDGESEPWVRTVARLAGVPWVVGTKERHGDRSVRIRFPPFPPAERATIVDDVAASGATLACAARLLSRRGVARVEAVVVHAVFAPGALDLVRRAGVRRVVSCDTIPHRTNAIRTVPLVAAALAAPARSRRRR
jgi:ribose-phosphate pyrophosphokinase